MTNLIDPFRLQPIIRAEFPAAPTIIGSGLSVPLDLPPGGPGQMMVAVIGNITNTSFSAPAGWNIISDFGTAGLHLCMAYKLRGASEPAPTFSRGAGTSCVGWIFGYTPSKGSLVYQGMTDAGGTSATITSASITLTAARNLLVVGMARQFFWDTLITQFNAASLAAGNPDGQPALSGGFNVRRDIWDNIFAAARSGPLLGVQSVALAAAPAGATGAFTHSIPFANWRICAAAFQWLP